MGMKIGDEVLIHGEIVCIRNINWSTVVTVKARNGDEFDVAEVNVDDIEPMDDPDGN